MRRLRSIIWPFWPYDRFLCSQSLHGFVRNQEKVSQAYEMSVSKKRVDTKRSTLHFFVRNGERFPLLLETNNAFRIVTQTYFNSEHTIDFCVVKVFIVLLENKKKFLKLTKRPWVRNDYIPNEQRCILLLEMNNVSLCLRLGDLTGYLLKLVIPAGMKPPGLLGPDLSSR